MKAHKIIMKSYKSTYYVCMMPLFTNLAYHVKHHFKPKTTVK